MTSPYSIYSASITVIAKALKTFIEAAPGGTFTIAPTEVFYGDQDLIPTTPALCVEPNDKNRTLEGAPNMTLNEFEILLLVYHNKVQDNRLTREETDVLAYELEKYLHTNLQLTIAGTPHVIHGFVRSNESGYAYKNNTLYRSARLTWYGKNKTSLAES